MAGFDNCTKENDKNASLLCLGDSLTAGHGAVTPGVDDKTKSYPAFLQNKINIPVINAGVSGDTSFQGFSRIKFKILSGNIRIVIINLGANDFLQGIPLEITEKNLQKTVKKVNNGKRKIYLAKFYTESVARAMAGDPGILGYDGQTESILKYDNMFKNIALSNGVELIEDIWAGVWGIHMSDNIHPNAAGYEIMANNIFNVLQPYLHENNLLKDN